MLVFEKDDKVGRGIVVLLGRLGLVVTLNHDPVRARDLLLTKFFAVALVDVDTPTTGAGLELLKFARDKSPLTTVIMMTARKAFDIGVAGFRGGAADVVVKEPATVPYLKDRVLAAAEQVMALAERNTVLEEVAELHEEFLRRMRELSRERQDLEERLLGRERTDSGAALDSCDVLLVDDDAEAASRLQHVLAADEGWRVHAALSGGEALDGATRVRPQILIVKEPLPDLPSRMVVSTLKAGAPDAVALILEPGPGSGGSGELRMVDGSRTMVLLAGFTSAEQLVAPLLEIREGLRQKLRERRYLQVFRQSNLDLLQRYNAIRQKIKTALMRARNVPS